ncbi:MAG TPA: FGGY-family carbohydrate kinase [Acidimicrobiia bacterium]|nr:FGGY-family carbohydrate kinase [Acidimicrobiia bacterium]
MSEVTVGIDIGTSSVKAIAADAGGNVVGSTRIPHPFHVPTPGRFEHDADEAWRRGPEAALRELVGTRPVGVCVAAMVPSLTAVDEDGVPVTPGLLYGDERGRHGQRVGHPAESGELLAFLRWTVGEAPAAAGYWPAQAVANHALAGRPVLDTTTAATAYPLFDWTGWDAGLAAEVGVRPEQLPELAPTGAGCARIGGPDGPALASGCIDALAEQLVAGADDDGDVLVILGTTLIVWAVTSGEDPVPDHYLIPHTAPGKMLVGGPSNAGGLFLNWATSLLRDGDPPDDPGRVPVWAPFPRGERVPLNDPERRAVLTGLDLTHGPGAVRRAAFEASGFVTRRMLEATKVDARRIVATGGGTRVDEWVQALADATGLPIDCVAVPEGGALGAAWLARIAAGLEEPTAMPEGRRWARTGRRVEPDARWSSAVDGRYEEFLEVGGLGRP